MMSGFISSLYGGRDVQGVASGLPMNAIWFQSNDSRESNAARDSLANQSKLHEADLKAIVHFFANPPEGIIEDEALWAAITEMVRPRLAVDT